MPNNPPKNDREKIQKALEDAVLIIKQVREKTEKRAPIGAGMLHELSRAVETVDRLWKDFYDGAKSVKKSNDNLIRELEKARAELLALADALSEKDAAIAKLQALVAILESHPNPYAVLHSKNPDGTLTVLSGGRKLRVEAAPDIKIDDLKVGQEVILNDGMSTIILAEQYEKRGEAGKVKDILEDGRVVINLRADEDRTALVAGSLERETIKIGDRLLFDPYSGYVVGRLPKTEVEDLALEEVPNVTYQDIGGLGPQIEKIKDAIELPYLYPEEFLEFGLLPPKGILLFGPPGCGKTMVAKAVANSLAKQLSEKTGQTIKGYFINIKGPELLDKYVGETERKIREVFLKAREKAQDDIPVIIFFDEIESLLRMRGMGISSDVESTIVPQFLAEIDGLESLKNVIVIGASNRQDLIDPAVLRPGRFDVKIKIDRPNVAGAFEILTKYVKAGLPLHPKLVSGFPAKYITKNRLKQLQPAEWTVLDQELAPMREFYRMKRLLLPPLAVKVDIENAEAEIKKYEFSNPDLAKKAQEVLKAQPTLWEHEEWQFDSVEDAVNYLTYKTVEGMFIPTKEALVWFSSQGELVIVDTRFLEVTYHDNEREVLYHKDFVSGAMIDNIVRRAKKMAVKRKIATGVRGLTMVDFWQAIREEFKENEDLPNTTNPDDWAKIIGRKGKRIINIKRMSGEVESTPFIRQVIPSGQYL